MDPLAEVQPNKTPYHYTSNNPINRIDPTGMLDDWYHNNETDELVYLRDVHGTMTQESVDKYGLGGAASDYERLGDNNVMGQVSEKFTGENILERENIKIGNAEQFMSTKGYMHIKEERIKKYEFTQKGFSFDESIINISDLEKVLSTKTRYIESRGFKSEKIIDIESHKSIFSDSKNLMARICNPCL